MGQNDPLVVFKNCRKMYLQQTPGHCIDSIITDSIRVWEDSLKFPPQRNRLLCASGYAHAHLARVVDARSDGGRK